MLHCAPRNQEPAVCQERVPAAEQLAGGRIGAGGIGNLSKPRSWGPELRLTTMSPEQRLAVGELAQVQTDDWSARQTGRDRGDGEFTYQSGRQLETQQPGAPRHYILRNSDSTGISARSTVRISRPSFS